MSNEHQSNDMSRNDAGMTEPEKLMLCIMGRISDTDAPIVFKGALITKLILSEHGYGEVIRTTNDIDANWVGASPSMSHLVDVVNQSLTDMQGSFTALAIREYAEGRSAGISIVDNTTGKEIFSVDISIKPVGASTVYYYGDIGIKGVLPDEVLADKIVVLSSRLLFRRMKDLVDVYAMSHCVDVRPKRIFEVCASKGRVVEDFDAFINRRPDVEQSYSKLKGIDGKPDFDAIYSYMSKFVEPFVQKKHSDMRWDSDTMTWLDDGFKREREEPPKPKPKTSKPSILAQIHEFNAKNNAQNQERTSINRGKRKSNNEPDQ